MAKISNKPHIYSTCIILLIIDIFFDVVESSTSAQIDKHLELGRELLARGQLQDALTHYHAAVEGDPSNYLTYFKRATIYLALGRSNLALPDLDRALELKPDFTAAQLQRGTTYLKQGRLDEAHIDFEMVLRKDPMNEEALNGYSVVEPLKMDVHSALILSKSGDCHSAIPLLSRIIETCPWDPIFREVRAECFVGIGDTFQAISDLKVSTKLRSDNTEGYLKLSHLYYKFGEPEESLKEIRECLKLDPDHKDCFTLYKKVKKVAKFVEDIQNAVNNKDYELCVDNGNKILKTEKEVELILFYAKQKLCHCNMKLGRVSESIASCDDALRLQEDPHVLCDRAEAHLVNDEFDEAMYDYQQALRLEEGLQRAREGLQRAQNLQKQAGRRNYYKILGVTRSATKQEIAKAYRKMAQKWHPDSYQGDEKKKAEKMFIDIAAAKEVLTDPEKRQKYDNGEDPLDPESQQGQGFNPFQHFHHFQGAPFQFKFNFN